MQRAARRAGSRTTGPHMLRHTFCSHLAMRGAPARAIQEAAGHQDLVTTQRYMHLSRRGRERDSAPRAARTAPGVETCWRRDRSRGGKPDGIEGVRW